MKVVYKKPILEQIHAAISEARKAGKEIDHIHLTKSEAEEARRACGIPMTLAPLKGGSIMGLQFVVDEGGESELIGKILDDVIKDIFQNVKPGGEAGCNKDKAKV